MKPEASRLLVLGEVTPIELFAKKKLMGKDREIID